MGGLMFRLISLFIGISVFTCSTLLADYDSSKALLSQAKKQNKIILIEAMSKNCHFCTTMEKEVFSQKNVKDNLSKNFIFVVIDIENKKLPFGLDKDYKGFTPSFFMIDSTGKLKNEYPGAWTEEDFIEILNENK